MRSFFFAPESPRLLALVRIVLGLVLFYDTLCHWRYAIELYSTFGPAIPIFIRRIDQTPDKALSDELPSTTAASATDPTPSTRLEPILPVPIPTPQGAVLAHTLLLFGLVSVTLGWHTRTSVAVTFLLALWLMPLDLAGTFGKHLVVALHLIFLLGFSRCGAVWSVDAWTDRNRRDYCRMSSACPRRLMQILICSVYLGAVITKIKTPTFVNGDLLTFSLLDDHWGGNRFGMWLTALRHVSLLLSFATLFYEALFPVLVWVPRCRLPLIVIAILVHSTMGWLLSLGPFSPIMFAALLSFLEERDLEWLGRHCRFGRLGFQARPELQGRAGKPSLLNATLYLSAAALFVASGYAIQFAFDWYGAFGRRTPAALQEIADADAREMLVQQLPAYEDYFHRIELGGRVGGNQVFGSPDRFRIGQRAYVLTQMPMPHPAVELEGLLIGPDGQECARFTHRFDPRFSYAINGFELTNELSPGTYRVILQAEGFVIAERRFDLEP